MDIITTAPWWVFALFFFLVIVGLTAVLPRAISLKRILFLPLVFTIWNVVWLAERIQGHFFLLIFWAAGLLIGAAFGWVSVRSWKIQADVRHKRLSLPGTWTTLVLILLAFSVRYFFIYNYEMHPEAASHLFISDALISGIITGIFIGRSLELYRKYRKTQ